MYDLSSVLDAPGLSSVEPGTCILVSGPAMTGTEDLVMDMLANGVQGSDGAVVVTTNGSAAASLEAISQRAPNVDPARIAAIDCRDGAGGQTETDRNLNQFRAADPSDVTGIGIGITNSFDQLRRAGVNRIRLGLVSLSTMLTYAEEKTVFKFCHVLATRIDGAGDLGAFTIDAGAHDEKTLQVLKQPFDALIEVREWEGSRQARVRGLEAEPSDWVPL